MLVNNQNNKTNNNRDNNKTNNKENDNSKYFKYLTILGITICLGGFGFALFKEKNKIDLTKNQEDYVISQLNTVSLNNKLVSFLKNDTNNNYLYSIKETINANKIKLQPKTVIFKNNQIDKDISLDIVKKEKIKNQYYQRKDLIESVLLPVFLKDELNDDLNKKFIFTTESFKLYEDNLTTIINEIKKDNNIESALYEVKPIFENKNDKMPIAFNVVYVKKDKNQNKLEKIDYIIKNSEKGMIINYKDGTIKEK